MKKLILIVFAILLAGAVNAQRYATFAADTLNDAETVYFTIPHTINAKMDYSFQLRCDSLSGSTAGTITIQQSNSLAGTEWTDITGKTGTINGVLSQVLIEGTVTGVRLRAKLVSTGTQATKVQCWFVMKDN